MENDFVDKLEQIFLSESTEILISIENDLINLEENFNNDEVKKNVLRNAHTLKGSIGMINAKTIAEFIHTFEEVLKELFKSEESGKKTFSFLLENVDYIKNLIHEVVRNKNLINEEQFKEKKSALNDYINNTKKTDNEKANNSQSFGFFEEKKSIKKKYTENVFYRINFFLKEKRIKNTWTPENLIDDLARIGRVINIAAKKMNADINWENFDYSQCYYGWIILLQTKEPLSVIEDVFLFFKDNNDLSIELIEGESLLKLGELLISEGKVAADDVKEALKNNGKLGETLIESKKISEDDVKTVLDKQKKLKADLSLGEELKISTRKVDRLIDLVGELIIANSNLNTFQQKMADTDFEQIQYNINKISKQMRDLILSLKMVPIGQLLARFYRIVRDISTEFKKKVNLTIEGENTELDRTMFDILQEPFLHIIRNSLDHGIELPDERKKLGKNETGRILIKSYQENGKIIIEIEDDGRGLDKEKIASLAIEKGLITRNRDYTEDQIFNIIFEPGFSTKKEVNLISGRGIGMDVVLTGIKRINGTIKTRSIKGQMTNFTIQVPLTLAIIEGFLVRIGQNNFVIAMQLIRECFELKADKNNQYTNEFNLRGEYLTLINLDKYLDGVKYEVSESKTSRQIIVLEHYENKIGIFVDEIMGNIQAVIKPINKLVNKSNIITGSTLLGNGDVALILDVANLFEKVKTE